MKKSVKRFLSVSMVIILFFSYIPFGGIAALSELMSVKSHAADSNDAGSVVTFGSYPQTLVTDEAITDVLTEKVFDGDIEFKAYDYKCGNGEDFDARGEEYMGYADAVYNGEKYRGVYFDLYRPVYSFFPATDDEDSSFQAENGYERYQFYWFKYEPLKWRVLDAESGLLL